MKKLAYMDRYSRELIQENDQVLFVFGDNLTQEGYGGQAGAARDEPNAVGIPTLVSPSQYFTNDDFDRAKPVIDGAFDRLWSHLDNGGFIIWPKDGVGTGIARLWEKAPMIAAYIEAKRLRLDAHS